MVNSHVCMFQERFDPSSRAKLLTIPRNELCLCQGVVAPQTSGTRSCHRRGDTDDRDNLWSTLDRILVSHLTDRRNWTPAKLDYLLERSHCCKYLLLVCSSLVYFVFIIVKENY